MVKIFKFALPLALFMGIICVLGFYGCPVRTPQTYEKAIQSGRKEIPAAGQFEELYGKTYHFISYYDGNYGKPTWNSKVGLFGRYILGMHVPVAFDHSGTQVIPQGEPKFYVWELKSIVPGKAGTFETLTGDDNLEFSTKEWNKVVEAKGDLRVLGLKMKKDQPLEHFDESFGPI
jgi:hypothetical protein